jgi:hypothetical protein
MDYFQGVVTEYLRANRSVFVNTEFLIQLDDGEKQLKDRHWYCDALAVNFKESKLYLCEITFSATMQALISRLQAWQNNWDELVKAVARDSGIPSDWKCQPWVFIPKKYDEIFTKKLAQITLSDSQMPAPRVTFLETVLPWEYRSWDRKNDAIARET